MFKRYYKKNSKTIRKVIVAIKGLSISVGGYSYFNNEPKILMIISVLGFVCVELLTFTSEEK